MDHDSRIETRHRRSQRWEHAAEWPLAVSAGAFVIAYSLQVLANLEGVAALATDLVMGLSWIVFAVDYVVRLALAPHRWRWFRGHLAELAMVALPVLRPLRILQVVLAFRQLQRRTGALVRGRVVAYASVVSGLLVYMAALSVLDAERDKGTITTLGDALWWAFVTVTTVGYGDYFPVTTGGRIVAVGLMLGGITLIGVVTATIASWIVERVSDDEESGAATQADVHALRDEIVALRASLEASRDRGDG